MIHKTPTPGLCSKFQSFYIYFDITPTALMLVMKISITHQQRKTVSLKLTSSIIIINQPNFCTILNFYIKLAYFQGSFLPLHVLCLCTWSLTCVFGKPWRASWLWLLVLQSSFWRLDTVHHILLYAGGNNWAQKVRLILPEMQVCN